MSKTILVTGATGNVGRQAVARLLDLGAALTRKAARGVQAVRGDLADPASLDAARSLIHERDIAATAVEDVTGRPARTFREWAADHADDSR